MLRTLCCRFELQPQSDRAHGRMCRPLLPLVAALLVSSSCDQTCKPEEALSDLRQALEAAQEAVSHLQQVVDRHSLLLDDRELAKEHKPVASTSSAVQEAHQPGARLRLAQRPATAVADLRTCAGSSALAPFPRFQQRLVAHGLPRWADRHARGTCCPDVHAQTAPAHAWALRTLAKHAQPTASSHLQLWHESGLFLLSLRPTLPPGSG